MKIWLRPLLFALLAAYGVARADRALVDDGRLARPRSAARSRRASTSSVSRATSSGSTARPASGAMRGESSCARPRQATRTRPPRPRTILRAARTQRRSIFSTSTLGFARGTAPRRGRRPQPHEDDERRRGPAVLRGSPRRTWSRSTATPRPCRSRISQATSHTRLRRAHTHERWQVKIADLQGTGNPLGVKKSGARARPAAEGRLARVPGRGPLEIKTDPPSDPPLLVDPVRNGARERARPRLDGGHDREAADLRSVG